MKKHLLFLLLSVFFLSQQLYADWQVTGVSQKSFIENRGQFDMWKEQAGGEILYAAEWTGTKILFTKQGATYFLYQHKKNPDRKKGDASKPKFIVKNDFVNLAWEGANTDVKIITAEKSEGYHSYTFFENGKEKNINHISGYKKIIYKNLYPNIDAEYIFHEQDGIKYSLILHPGADVSKIKMKYPVDRKISTDNDGKLHIETMFGDIIEHAPVSYYEYANSEIIPSSISLKNNTVNFTLAQLPTPNPIAIGSQLPTIIIDPWVQSPALTAPNCVWEVETDASGNVYVIGGGMPMVLQKYNSGGTFQWTYNTPWDTANSWLGTLATDLAGNSYITSGSSAAIQKVNTSGGMVWSATGGSFDEYWNIVFNCDQTKLIVGGTRIMGFPSPTGDGVIFDINPNNGNVTSMQTVGKTRTTVIFGIPVTDLEEVRSISSSRNAKYYFLTLDTLGAITQNLSTCPNGTLFGINHTYSFGYKCESYRMAEGNSGIKAIRANDQFVYTLNGTTLHKRSLATGAIISSVAIPGGISSSSQGLYQVGSAGIDVDSCGFVYVGSGNGVYKFDSNLNQITSASTSFAVYDVVVSPGGEVVVCGGTGNSSSSSRTGHVQSFNMSSCVPFPLICCDATVCPAGPVCQTASPFNLTPALTGGTFSGPGITNASAGTFNPSVAGVGTHTIVYTQSCGSDSITIVVNSCATLTACQENNGNITVTSGTGPYTWYEWNPGGSTPITNQAECVACGYTWNTFANQCFVVFPTPADSCVTPAGWQQFATGTTVTPGSNYPILVVSSTNDSLQISSLSSLPNCTACSAPSVTMSSAATTCGLSNGTATATASGGTSPYTYNWNNGVQTQSIASLQAGTYSVTVSGGGCDTVASVTVGSSTGITATATSTATSCGASNGTATANPGGGTSYTYSWNTTPVQTTQTATGLPAGTYSVTVTSNNNCTATATTIVNNTGGPTVVMTSNAATCGNNNGSSTATPSGGTSPYTYSWNTSPVQTGQTATGLAAGSYSVTVTDNAGCTVSDTITVSGTAAVTASGTSTDASCGLNNGTASVTPGGGNSSYTYSWNTTPVQTTATATGLAAGNYSVTVTSAGCTAVTSVTVNPSSGMTAATTFTNASCGQNNGTATVNASGGNTPYSYSWNTTPVQTTQTATGLGAGTYSVTVTESGGGGTPTVFFTETFNSGSSGWTLNGGTGTNIWILNNVYTGATCNVFGSPIATVPPTPDEPAAITGNPQSPYLHIHATDPSFCDPPWPPLNANFDTNQPSDQEAVMNTGVSTTGKTNVSFKFWWLNVGDNTSYGQVYFSNNGGSSWTQLGGNMFNQANWIQASFTNANFDNQADLRFKFRWLNGGSGSDNAFSVDELTLSDSAGGAGCTVATSVTVNSTSSITASATSTNSSCTGNTGTATANSSGGTSPFTYLWSNSQTTQTISGLAAGNYDVTVTDSAGCTATASVIVSATGAPVATASASGNVTCNGGNNGSATVSASGGTSPYTYNWSNGAGTDALQGVSAGTYYVTVTDNNNCPAIDSVVITEPAAITDTITTIEADCGASNGSATIIANGGNPSYSYLWDAGANSQTSATATGLAAGSYNVTITDASGCTKTSVATISNVNAPGVSTTFTNPSCNGGNNGSATASVSGGTSPYSYLWSNGGSTDALQGVSAGTYIVTVTDAAGCIAVTQLTLTDPAPVTVSFINSDSLICAGNTASVTASAAGAVSYVWSTGQNTAAISVNPSATTDYIVTVTDNNNCTGTDTFTVNVISVSDTIAGPNLVCVGERAVLSVNPGNTAYLWSTGETTSSITVSAAVPSPVYSVTVTTSCGDVFDSFTLNVSDAPVVSAGNDTTIYYGTSAELMASGGTSYYWSTGQNTNPILVAPDGNTIYYVTVTDESGCADSASVAVIVDDTKHAISVPTVFSPNGDGINDFIRVFGYGIKEFKLTIYDRWGEVVFTTTDKTIPWDGMVKGKPVNSAVFVYILEATFGDDTKFFDQGNISLVR